MALRTGHGRGKGEPRIEALPFDELPAGIPGDTRPENPNDRGPGGQFAPKNSLAAKGGKAKRGKTKLAHKLGLKKLPEGSAFKEYKLAASAFRVTQCAEISRTVGGGICGIGPSSMIASAALALAWSRYLSDLAAATGDEDLAEKAISMAERSSQLVAKAHEYAARQAAARPKQNPMAALRAQMDAIVLPDDSR